MIFMTKRDFEEEVRKRIDEEMKSLVWEKRVFEMGSRIDALERKVERMEIKIKDDPIPFHDNACTYATTECVR